MAPTGRPTRLALTLILAALGSCAPAPLTSPSPRAQPAARLAGESSPYLRQHADNLVAWYPWGEEAFAKAREENKPIFLSVGYSTCHWCHVMEQESFMDPAVAEQLNASFVPIKVDRETRPDIDRLYMGFLVGSTGSGGWPMSVFLTPDGKPFWAGTYLPNPARYGRPGFLDLLEEIARNWKSDPEGLTSNASEIAQRMAEASARKATSDLPNAKTQIQEALRHWREGFDTIHGGFGSAPKFPQSPVLSFLLQDGALYPKSDSQSMVLTTLDGIALGGIHDHLEGGFHRYSTDEAWRVPHFEKMLSDQAQLLSLYSRAYALTGRPLYKEAAEGIVSYLQRRLRLDKGGFASAEDADSADPASPTRHREGAFYLWTAADLERALEPSDWRRVREIFGITSEGNAGPELAGQNVLALKRPLAVDDSGLVALLSRLRKARDTRPRPARDEKVLAAWNAMTAGALAEASVALGRPELSRVARELLAYLESALVVNGELRRSSLDGKPADIPAFAQDYAEMVAAYLAVYAVDGEPAALQRAVFWQAEQDRNFLDAANGGYYETRADHGLLFREKEMQDGASLSTAGRSALNLARLYRLTGNEAYRKSYQALLRSVGHELDASPWSLPGVLAATELIDGPEESAVLVGARPRWWDLLRKGYHPQRCAHWIRNAASRQDLMSVVPFLGSLPAADAVYFCQDFRCGLPITSEAALRQRLASPFPEAGSGQKR